MAATRFAGPKANWKNIFERFPQREESEMAKLLKLRKTHESFMKRLVELPEKQPTIDWASYKAKIPNAAFVDAIKQKYEALAIPYPKSNVNEAIDSKEKELAEAVAEFRKENDVYKKQLEERIAVLEAMLPRSEMTRQEYKQAYPEAGMSVQFPTPFPHDDPDVNRQWRIYIAAKEKGLPVEKPADKEE